MESTATLTGAGIESPSPTALQRVFSLLGGPAGVRKALLAAGIDIKTDWAVNKWLRAGRLPRTEYTGETSYARVLEAAVGGQVKAAELLEQGRRSAA